MGTAMSQVNQQLGWGGVPDTDRATYFKEQLMMGWYELLCCPSAMGCVIVSFKPGDPSGGQAEYKIKLRLSHSEHVPRYQLHVVYQGKTRQWIVGHMEKTETHLRAKPGEFIRAQVWKITCNSWVYEKRRSALHRKGALCFSAVKERPTPTAEKMEQMGMTIATQAKNTSIGWEAAERKSERGRGDERWIQPIGVSSKNYKLSIEPPSVNDKFHGNVEDINVLRILYQGKKVCVARKQRFAGTLGKVCRPYLGVQIKPSKFEKSDAEKLDEQEGGLEGKSLLDTHELMLLLMCLAWSEETMSPTVDRTEHFIQAMRARAGEQGSADWQGLSVQWNTDDVRERLKHVPYAELHNWGTEADQKPPDEEEFEDDDEPSGDVEQGGRNSRPAGAGVGLVSFEDAETPPAGAAENV